MGEIVPLLMFEGQAEEAMSLYVDLFGGEVLGLTRYGPDQQGAEGSVMQARFRLRDQMLLCMDSSVRHAFTFTPSLSLFVACRDEADMERLAEGLLAGGEALMPPGDYGFSRRFAWVKDRYGVSWQLNLA